MLADPFPESCAEGPVRIDGAYDSEYDADHPNGDFRFTAIGIEIALDQETGALKIVDAVVVVDVATIVIP